MISTPLGDMIGTAFDGGERYAGIRYAQPPVGPLRFAPPVPVEPWDGVYEATAFGASAPQPPPVAGVIGVQRDLHTDEDCLFLNVFTPKADDGARPVMVWIHGGAYSIGSGDIYDGRTFVRNGDVVVVTLNYRLGALGWLPLDHLDPALTGSGNNGLRDQIEALRWVRDNIAVFGGDPGNVTIFGESAGAGSVMALLAAPAAEGLYHRAIVQSAPPGFGPPTQQAEMTSMLLDALGQPDGGIDALRGASPEELVAAQAVLSAFDKFGVSADVPVDGSGLGFHPVVDGVVIEQRVVDALRAKGAKNVPMLIGTNRDEGTLFGLLLPQGPTDEQMAEGLAGLVDDPASVVQGYKGLGTGHPPLVDLFTDGVFRIPSLRCIDAVVATGVPVWVYLFTWKTPVFGGMLGATHALEIPFAWDMVRDPQWAGFVGAEPPAALAEAMHQAWIAFARTGKPEAAGLPHWPTYDTANRPTMELGDTCSVLDDPDPVTRKLWG